jgi:deazaflavin-dependent oxidoreductase (nitroreductase family)
VSEGEPRKTLFERIAERLVSTRPGAWFYVNLAPYIDRPLLRMTNGTFSMAGFRRIGVLIVRGAKTGAERRTPLVITRDGDRILLVASRGGDVKHPAWYRNVVANPDVRVLFDGTERSYRAHEAQGEERDRAWRLCNRTYAGYAAYQRRAGDRVIPVMVLEPAGSEGPHPERRTAGT